mmetsp:Transcript_55233/g.131664  ORF Transcript_55233/g.131664 Transcript_55233/m.131664 type:complete len:341 (+) Transcript_55233:78-1100(+)
MCQCLREIVQHCCLPPPTATSFRSRSRDVLPRRGELGALHDSGEISEISGKQVQQRDVSEVLAHPRAASDEVFQRDRRRVLDAVSSMRCTKSLHYAAEEWRSDRDIMLAAVAGNSMALAFASDSLRADKEVVLAALNSKGATSDFTLCFASEALRGDREVVLAAVSRCAAALNFASAALLDSRGFILETVAVNGSALEFVGDHFRRDREVVLAAVAQQPVALEFVPEDFPIDDEILQHMQAHYVFRVALLSGRSCIIVKSEITQNTAARLMLRVSHALGVRRSVTMTHGQVRIEGAALVVDSTVLAPSTLPETCKEWSGGLRKGEVTEMQLIVTEPSRAE